MKMKYLIWLTGAVALLAGCQGARLLPPSNELVVVRAYLEAGGRLRNVHVASTLDLGSPDTLGPPVKDASVHIIRNEVCYELTHFGSGNYGAPSNPYTTDCPDCGLSLNPGDTIYLEIFHFGKIATSHTVIPPEPVNLSISENPVIAPSSGQATPEGKAFELNWDLEGDYWFYVEISNLESPKLPVDGGEPFTGYAPPVITEPFRDKRYIVTCCILEVHQVTPIFKNERGLTSRSVIDGNHVAPFVVFVGGRVSRLINFQ